MRHLLPFLLLLAPATLPAQIPIAEARDLPVGTVVTVSGIVLNGPELGGIRYVQDATAGMAVFPGTGSTPGFSPPRGAQVTVTGPLKLFNGLLEIDPVTAHTVNSTGNPLPAPQLIAPDGMGASNESELVRIQACVFSGGGGTFSNGTQPFTSNGVPGVVFLRSNHPLVGSTIPAGAVDLVGIVSRFSTATPPVGGYQLLLRDAADMIPSNTITVIGEVAQTDISANAFTLRWSTNLEGSARVRYGLTPAFGSLASAMGTGTSHVVLLPGLQAATAYWAQAFSVQGSDTAWATAGVYSTASADPGEILVYFNQPVDNTVATGPAAMDLGSALVDTIRAYIDRAQHTLEIAVYNTSFNGIVNSVNAAHARGVQVRYIAEGSTGNSALNNLVPGIPVLFRQNSTGSGMHNKFIIADADAGPTAHVLTGSANFTAQSFFQDANNLVIVRDMALARAYRMEFDEMWGGSGAQPVPANSRFGEDKADNTPHHFNINGTAVQLWFSPSDGTTARIAQALSTADQHIEFALFAFTSNPLADALIERQSQPQVNVRGMIEEDDMDLWTYQALLDGGVDVRPDGAPNFLHHKYAIVDRHVPGSDPLVITGSHNWSFNAENRNDENTLIIHDAGVADQFHQEWQARWTTAVTVPDLGTPEQVLQLWPNPTNGLLHVAMAAPLDDRSLLRVVDMAGRTVLEADAQQGLSTIAVDALAPGTYVLLLEGPRQRAQRLFVRQR
jgi:phosphatidylserine/phosphatidylglycerophosphate/cardiolipin synthase-like enzyme